MSSNRVKKFLSILNFGKMMRIIEMKGQVHDGPNGLGIHSIFDGRGYYSAHIEVKVYQGRIANIWIVPQVNNPHNAHHDLFVDNETGTWMMMYAYSNMDWR